MDNYIKRPPKLMFSDDEGVYYMEYIPKNLNWLEQKFHNFKLNRRIKKHLPLYYWHYRDLVSPLERKVLDLNFILHVFTDHSEQDPKDKYEFENFFKIYQHYALELNFFLSEKSEYKRWGRKKHSKNIHLQKDPYYLAYKKRWIDTFSYGPNFKLFYHGVGPEEAINFIETIESNIKNDLAAVAKSFKMSIDEYTTLMNSKIPEQPEVKKSQKPPKNYKVSSLSGWHIIYWATNAILTFTIIFAQIVRDVTYSASEKFSYGFGTLIVLQIVFLTPYLAVVGLIKLFKKLFNKKSDASTNQEE